MSGVRKPLTAEQKRRKLVVHWDWLKRNPAKRLYHAAKRRARQRGLEFSITVNDVVVPERCPVFGIPLGMGTRKARRNAPSLDRIDPGKGYVPGNVIVISWRANDLKKDASLDELRALVSFLEGLQR